MGDPSAKYKSTAAITTASVLAGCCSIAVLVLVCVWIFVHMNGLADEPKLGGTDTSQLFNWHPFLMVLAFPIFMTEALLIYRREPGVQMTRDWQKFVHGLLHTFAAACVVVALAAVFTSHIRHEPEPKADLNTTHSYLGITALCLFGAQYLLGVVMFVIPGMPEASKETFVDFHKFVGTSAYFTALATMTLGFQDKAGWLRNGSADPGNYFTADLIIPAVASLVVAVLGILVAYVLSFGSQKSRPSEFDEPLLPASTAPPETEI